MEEIGVPGENHWPAASHWQSLSHIVVSTTPRLSGTRTHNVSGDRHWLHIKRFALFDLLKSLYSDTKILSKYIPSLQKRLYAMHFHIVKMYKDKEVKKNVESDFKAPNLPLSLRFKGSGCHYNSI
jgi:hypothetical protein